jgi:hypothetical protein
MKRVFSLVLTTAMLAGGLAALAQPAAAEPLSDCQAGARGTTAGPITLRGSSALGVSVLGDVRPHDVFRVDWVGGQVKIGEWPWDPSYGTPGAGWGNLADDRFYPVWGVPKYSLVGVYNLNAQGGYLGPGACFQYRGSTSTFLWLQMNDSYSVDNSGSWNLILHQFR